MTPASLLDEAAYLHRIGDYSQEQRLLQTLLADIQTEPAQGQETPAASPRAEARPSPLPAGLSLSGR